MAEPVRARRLSDEEGRRRRLLQKAAGKPGRNVQKLGTRDR